MQLSIFLSSLAVVEAHRWNHHHHGHHGGHGGNGGNNNQDECGAAVTARNTEPARSIRESDCSSFMTSTITVLPVTATTSIPDAVPKLHKRQDPEDSLDPIPEYAIDACSDDPSLYSSACDAWGIYEDTITLLAQAATDTTDAGEATPTSTPIKPTSDQQKSGDGFVTIQNIVTFIATTVDITITVDPSGTIASEGTAQVDTATLESPVSIPNTATKPTASEQPISSSSIVASTAISSVSPQSTVEAQTKPVSPVVGSCPNPIACESESACSADRHCLCQPSVDGIGYCLADIICSDLESCTTNSDCGDGSACTITCCTSNKCLSLPFLCPNPGTPMRLFAKKDIEEQNVPTTNGVNYSGLGRRQDDEGTSNAVPPGSKAKKN